MKTPAGKECPQYYADFHRGRHVQECRLVSRNAESARPWRPTDCALCNVPEIVRANASPDMRLKLTIKNGFLGLGRRLVIEAYCEKHQLRIDNPIVGCPRCNAERPGASAFAEALENLDLPE